MAKRIKVKGKTPRGLSKAQRRVINPLESKRAALISYDRNLARAGAPEGVDPELVERLDYMIEDALERRAGDISSIPSSTRKKLVKEGSPKFIGPRTFKSELAEYRKLSSEPGEYSGKKPKKLRAPGQRLRAKDGGYDSDPEYGRGSIGSKKLKKLLYRLLDRHRGGG